LVVWATRAEVPALLNVLDHESGVVRAAALEALGNLKDQRAVAPVALRLLQGDRGHAGKALRAMGPMAEKEVLKYLRDTDAGVRAEACKVLKRIGTGESGAPLDALRGREPHRAVRVAAQDALQTIAARLKQ